MVEEFFNYIKSYIKAETDKKTSQLLQICHENNRYRFSVERLVYRRFYKDDYKMYIKKRKINSEQYYLL